MAFYLLVFSNYMLQYLQKFLFRSSSFYACFASLLSSVYSQIVVCPCSSLCVWHKSLMSCAICLHRTMSSFPIKLYYGICVWHKSPMSWAICLHRTMNSFPIKRWYNVTLSGLLMRHVGSICMESCLETYGFYCGRIILIISLFLSRNI